MYEQQVGVRQGVGSYLIFYFKHGDPTAHRDPDVLVAKGVGKHERRSYRLWEEKQVPCTLFEIASKNTWRIDKEEKPLLYAQLGVKEYFLFDPEGCYLDPVLQVFRTVHGKPVPMKPATDGSLTSRQLELRLVPDEGTSQATRGKPVVCRLPAVQTTRHGRAPLSGLFQKAWLPATR